MVEIHRIYCQFPSSNQDCGESIDYSFFHEGISSFLCKKHKDLVENNNGILRKYIRYLDFKRYN